MELHENKISAFSRFFIFSSAALVLCNYYYLYFIQFNEGVSEDASFYSYFKIIGILFSCSALLRLRVRRKYFLDDFLLIFLLFFAIFIFFLKSVVLGISDLMFLNSALCILPFFIFKEKMNEQRLIFFYDSCLFIVCLQVVVDFYIYHTGHSLWNNKAFVGGLGNASSFGVVCNILISYVLFFKPAKRSSIFYFVILSYAIYMSSSMLSVVMLIFLACVWFYLNVSFKNAIYPFLALAFVVLLSFNSSSDHLLYKVGSALDLLEGNGSDNGSRSVSLRVEIHKIYVDNISSHPIQGLLYGFNDESYMKFDSQILTYLSSFGIILTISFLLIVAYVMVKKFRCGHLFSAICLLLFLLTFFSNRILDYYPLPIFFALAFIMERNKLSSARRFPEAHVTV